MKRYGFHLLPRSPELRYSQFGYGTIAGLLWPPIRYDEYAQSSLLGSERFQGGLDWVEFGASLYDPTGGMQASPDVFKAIDYGIVDKAQRKAAVIERYFTRSARDAFTPYRTRLRYAHGVIDDMLHLQNLDAFHQTLTGTPVSFIDPLSVYSEAAVENQLFYPQGTPPSVWEVFQTFHWGEAPPFAHTEFRDIGIADRISRAMFSPTDDSRWTEFSIPKPQPLDHFTRNHVSGPIPYRDIELSFMKSADILTDRPDVLEPNAGDGEVLYTPHAFARSAALLNDLHMTDLDVKYILLQGKLSEPEVNMALDRYGHLVPALTDQRIRCAHLAETAFSELSAYLINRPDHDELKCSELTVRIILTFNDEALLIFRPNTKRTKGGLFVHIDLALLGLCAPGAAIAA